RGKLSPQVIKDSNRQAAGVRFGLEHLRRYGTNQHELGDAAGTVPCDIARRLATAGGMADVDCVTQVQPRCQRCNVCSVGVHVVALGTLAGAPVATTVVGDDAIALLEKEQQLRVPVVAAQRPAMVEDD